MSGWIKLHRTLKDWEYYEDHNATRLLIHLLVSVNYEDKKWKDTIIKSGTLVTSWQNLAHETGLTLKQIRLAMSKLERARETVRSVAGKGAGKWQVVTLVKWDKLQGFDDEVGQIKGQEKGRTREGKKTPTKEVKNKEVKNKEIYINPTNVELIYDARLDFSGFNDSFSIGSLWAEWIEYKKLQHKESYKTTKSEQTALNNLQKLCRGDTETARHIIEQSIGNLWRGLFELKQTGSNLNQNQKPQTQLDYEKQHINAHVYKSLRGFEQSRSISAGTLKVARHYLSQTTTVIDVHEFASLLDQIENAGGIPDTVDFGTPIWLGLRESEQNNHSSHLRLPIDGAGEFND